MGECARNPSIRCMSITAMGQVRSSREPTGSGSESSFPCGVWRGKQNKTSWSVACDHPDATGAAGTERLDPGEEISLANISPPTYLQTATLLICPQINGPGSLHLGHRRRSHLPPESSVRTVTTGPSQLRSRSSRVGSSPVLPVSLHLHIRLPLAHHHPILQSRYDLCNLCSACLGTPSFLAKYRRCIYLD